MWICPVGALAIAAKMWVAATGTCVDELLVVSVAEAMTRSALAVHA
jgi:hypothetical protein